MKNLKKFVVPAILCSTLTAFAPITITSCAPDDTIVGYTVDRDFDCIYGLDKDGKKIVLSYKQLDELKGGFLITRRGEAGYIYVDKDGNGSDGKNYPNTVTGFIDFAREKGYFEYELFLINGDYELNSVTKKDGSHPKIWLNGIMGYDGQLLSNLDCIPGQGDEPGTSKIDLDKTPYLSLRSLKVLGSMKTATGQGWTVTGMNELNVEWSYFYGKNIFTTPKAQFESTWFNSSDIILNEQNKTDYAIWLLNTLKSTFTDCHFYSRGKAAKIYLPEHATTGGITQYVFDACDFNISEKLIPENTVSEGQYPDQNKFCVDLNNKEVGFTAENKMQVYYNWITGDIEPTPGVVPAANYKTMHNGIAGSVDTRQFDNNLAEIHVNELP